MSDKQKVTLMIDGKPVQVRITRSTTCDDVIRTLINNKLVTDDKVEIVQSANGLERRVHGKTKVAKLVRASGAKISDRCLSLRSIEPINKSDKRVFSQIKAKVQRVTAKFRKNHEDNTLLHSMASTDKTNVYSRDLALDILQDLTVDKLATMKRYMDDVMTFSPVASGKRSRCGEASLCYHLHDIASMRSDEEMFDETCADIHVTETQSYMNEAFLNGSINNTVTEITTDLNVCMIEEDCCSETESAFDDDSDMDSVNELDRNVFTASSDCSQMSVDRIRKLFGSGNIPGTSGDSMLESFMKTLIQQAHQSDDEGVSSMGSELL